MRTLLWLAAVASVLAATLLPEARAACGCSSSAPRSRRSVGGAVPPGFVRLGDMLLPRDELPLFMGPAHRDLLNRQRRSAVNATHDSQHDFVQVGDMLIPVSELPALSEPGDNNTHAASTYSMKCPRPWPQGKVFYKFRSHFSSTNKALIRNSLSRLSSRTGNMVQFIEVSEFSLSHVSVIDGSGCYSYLGRSTTIGAQTLSLSVPGCMTESTVQHEFLHALGFFHEHERPDRNSHVRIFLANIRSDKCHNFYRYTYSIPADYPAYDINSVMHYRSSAFSCNSQSTILPLNSSTLIPSSPLSSLDVSKVQYVYNSTNLNSCTGTTSSGCGCIFTSLRVKRSAEAEAADVMPGFVKMGNIIVPEEDLQHFQAAEVPRRQKRAAAPSSPSNYISCRSPWPEGKLHYKLSPYLPSASRSLIRSSLASMSASTGYAVEFIEVSLYWNAYVYVTSNSGCKTYVGKATKSSRQTMWLSSCMTRRDIQQMFMFTLGFYWEHQRADRDYYVTVNGTNIMNTKCSRFQRNNYYIPTDYPTYDANSILHYASFAFSCNGLPTIRRRNSDALIEVGGLSTGDIRKLRYVYSPQNLEFCAAGSLRPQLLLPLLLLLWVAARMSAE